MTATTSRQYAVNQIRVGFEQQQRGQIAVEELAVNN